MNARNLSKVTRPRKVNNRTLFKHVPSRRVLCQKVSNETPKIEVDTYFSETMENSPVEDAINQDPDYATTFSSEATRQDLFEINARTNVANKIHQIIEAEFTNEINSKKKEIFKISKSLRKACRLLHYLRFAIITDFYGEENANSSDNHALKQSRPHAAIINAVPAKDNPTVESSEVVNTAEPSSNAKRKNDVPEDEPQTKLPHLDSKNQQLEALCEKVSRKCKRRIIVGNISKWIPPELRYNNASHKWTVYVRDSHKSDIGLFVSKVRFFLHPSYKPNDVVELTSPPFHLVRHGWGEFPVRVQLHFTNDADKPVDVIHHLKLDRTFTGLQTIGSETIVDLWITVKEIPVSSEHENQSDLNTASKTQENCDNRGSFNFLLDHDYFGFTNESNVEKACSETGSVTSEMVRNQPAHNSEANSYGESQNNANVSMTNFEKVSLTNSNSNAKSKLVDSPARNQESLGQINPIRKPWSETKSAVKENHTIYNKSEIKAENMVLLIELTRKSKLCSVLEVLKFIIGRMPLFTEKSSDPLYKMLHPYACEDHQTYMNYSLGKQLAIERQRALGILNVLEEVKYIRNTWTVKELIIWARRYCYTPVYNFATLQKICSSREKFDLKNNYHKYQSSSAISKELDSWLSQCQKSEPIVANNTCKDDDDDIDIISVEAKKLNSLSEYNSSIRHNNPAIFLEYCGTQNNLNEYTWRTVQKLGLKLTNEQIIPGVFVNISDSLISRAVECLMDDLIRLSFSCAIDRCENEKDTISVKLEDVRMALLKREEFDIFTNSGLGSDG